MAHDPLQNMIKSSFLITLWSPTPICLSTPQNVPYLCLHSQDRGNPFPWSAPAGLSSLPHYQLLQSYVHFSPMARMLSKFRLCLQDETDRLSCFPQEALVVLCRHSYNFLFMLSITALIILMLYVYFSMSSHWTEYLKSREPRLIHCHCHPSA